VPTLDLELTAPQEAFVFSEAEFPAMVAGFGAGKSHALVVRTIVQCLSDGLNRAYLAPTYDLLRLIAFPRFCEVLEQLGLEYKLNKSDGVLILQNGANVIFRTMETPDRLVGFEVADAACDELDTLKRDHAEAVWNKILSRCRLKKPGGKKNSCSVGTTPEGFRFVYERWAKNPVQGYELIKAPTSSNPTLPTGYIDALIRSYPANLQAAYLNGDFVNMTAGTVYNSYDRHRCNSNESIITGEALFIGQDFNVGNMASVVFVNRAGIYHAVAEITGGRDTPSVIEIIKAKWPESKIRIYPDASGGSRKTINASTSDLALFEQAGFSVIAPKANPPVKDRILAVNSALEYGKVRVNYAACQDVAECLEQQSYDKNGEPDKTQGNDHMNDAFGYFTNQTFPIVKPMLSFVTSFAV
jgi:hypothetical protein